MRSYSWIPAPTLALVICCVGSGTRAEAQGGTICQPTVTGPVIVDLHDPG